MTFKFRVFPLASYTIPVFFSLGSAAHLTSQALIRSINTCITYLAYPRDKKHHFILQFCNLMLYCTIQISGFVFYPYKCFDKDGFQNSPRVTASIPCAVQSIGVGPRFF